MELIKIKVNILEYLIYIIGDVIRLWQAFAPQRSEISCRLLSTRYMSIKAGQQSYWQSRESLASPVQSQLIGITHGERLRELGERGENNREMSPLGVFETTETNSSQRGAEALTWERNSCQELPGENTPAPGSCQQGQTEARWDRQWRVQRWSHYSAGRRDLHSSPAPQAWRTCLGVEPDFSCHRFGNEVKIRLNLHKKWEVSGEVFCCLILWQQSGNCTPGCSCEIAATDNQKWDRFFYLDFRVPEMQISILLHPIPVCKQIS